MSEPEEQCIICLELLPRPSASAGGVPDEPSDPALASFAAAAAAASSSSSSSSSPSSSSSSFNAKNTASSASSAAAAAAAASAAPAAATTTTTGESDSESSYLNILAALDGCDHIIHDACIRSWAQKTNTCPICRTPFHSVRVYNGLDGTAISTYEVQDKKQVAEFDVHQWLGENPEEEEDESHQCPICSSAEREDVLLLCDSCDAVYHTYCIGLDDVPEGDWYCMECAHLLRLNDEPETDSPSATAAAAAAETLPARHHVLRRPMPRSNRGFHVRTVARLKRARRQARNAEWQGAWGQFSGRFYEMSDLDLDNLDDEDEDLESFRRFQQLDRRELQRWQQRISIAQRLGAHESFADSIPPQISERLQPGGAAAAPPPPPPPVETRDERRAWGAFERVRDEQGSSPSTRKRKTRSITGSPVEPPSQEPERKLKRPRTRRLPHTEGAGAGATATTAVPSAGPSTGRAVNGAVSSSSSSRPVNVSPTDNEPTLIVSSLLKELEPNAQSDDEGSGAAPGWRHGPEASSPALSPTTSAYSSPRALSLTPPPLPSANGRPTSPTLSLSTHIEPIYPPANYSPSRHGSGSGSEHSDSESRPTRNEGRPLELRQPRPRRAHQIPSRQEEGSSRWTMTQEEKRSINEIVKNALRPHWRAQRLTTEQYATINRDISRKLYDEVKDASSLDDKTRRSWEKRATQEVAQAVSELQA